MLRRFRVDVDLWRSFVHSLLSLFRHLSLCSATVAPLQQLSMPTLFPRVVVDSASVAALLQEHWHMELGPLLKQSQNTTFSAQNASGKRFAVRATPDDRGGDGDAAYARICDELLFVSYIYNAGCPGVCAPVPPLTGGHCHGALRGDGIILCVFEWAQGVPVDFGAYRWMTDECVVNAIGAWLGHCHQASMKFAEAHAEVCARMRPWWMLHDRLMEGTPLAPEDACDVPAAGGCSSSWGVLHGDCNVSNFHLVSSDGGAPALSVFDWDQACCGWWELDLAQAALACSMLAEGGALPSGEPVPVADPAAFKRWLLAGYDRVRGRGAADGKRFDRLLQQRKLFYWRFCERARAEGDAPADMDWFIDYVLRWMSRVPVLA
jgi:Ser/Thr protein kinase RdoA (MazF antagonist)